MAWLTACLGEFTAEAEASPDSAVAMTAFASYLQALKFVQPRSPLLTAARQADLLPRLTPVLSGPNHAAREAALRALCMFEQPLHAHPDTRAPAKAAAANRHQRPEEEVFSGPCTALATCLQVETVETSLATERVRTAALEQLEVLVRSRRIPDVLLPPVLSYMFGVLYIKFAPLWPCATRVVSVAAEAGFGNVLWAVFLRRMPIACRSVSDRRVDADANADEPAPAIAPTEERVSGAEDLKRRFHDMVNADAAGHTDSETYHRLLFEVGTALVCCACVLLLRVCAAVAGLRRLLLRRP